jgi:hypothetical protein
VLFSTGQLYECANSCCIALSFSAYSFINFHVRLRFECKSGLICTLAQALQLCSYALWCQFPLQFPHYKQTQYVCFLHTLQAQFNLFFFLLVIFIWVIRHTGRVRTNSGAKPMSVTMRSKALVFSSYSVAGIASLNSCDCMNVFLLCFLCVM